MTRARNLILAAWAVALCGGAVLGQSPSGDPLNKCGMGFQPVSSPAGSRCHTCSHRFETGDTQRISPLQQAASGGDETVLGTSTALTGPAAQRGLNMRSGVFAALDAANQSGGIHGRTLPLISLDDGDEPSRPAANIHKSIGELNIIGLIQKLLFDAIESSAGADAARQVGRWVEVGDPFVNATPVASVNGAGRCT